MTRAHKKPDANQELEARCRLFLEPPEGTIPHYIPTMYSILTGYCDDVFQRFINDTSIVLFIASLVFREQPDQNNALRHYHPLTETTRYPASMIAGSIAEERIRNGDLVGGHAAHLAAIAGIIAFTIPHVPHVPYTSSNTNKLHIMHDHVCELHRCLYRVQPYSNHTPQANLDREIVTAMFTIIENGKIRE